MRWLLLALIVLMAGGAYYYFLYPPSQLQRRTERALAQFDAVMVQQEKAQVGPLLQRFLSDSAAIRLEVSFFSPLQGSSAAPAIQDFDKPTFIAFIDNVLYPLEDYSYNALLRSFALKPDHKSAAITFVSKEWADGVSMYGGTSVNVRYSADSDCTGEVSFEADQVRLEKADCKMELRTVPKPGEESKFHNMETLQDLLKH